MYVNAAKAEEFTSPTEDRALARSSQRGTPINPPFARARRNSRWCDRVRRAPSAQAYQGTRSRSQGSIRRNRRRGRCSGHRAGLGYRCCHGRSRCPAADRKRQSLPPSTRRPAQKSAPSTRSGRSEDIFLSAGAFVRHILPMEQINHRRGRKSRAPRPHWAQQTAGNPMSLNPPHL
jgi:hypothetical protein